MAGGTAASLGVGTAAGATEVDWVRRLGTASSHDALRCRILWAHEPAVSAIWRVGVSAGSDGAGSFFLIAVFAGGAAGCWGGGLCWCYGSTGPRAGGRVRAGLVAYLHAG